MGHTAHTAHRTMPSRLLYSEKRFHSGCGKRCVRCWTNKLKHACPEAQMKARADTELWARECAAANDEMVNEMQQDEMDQMRQQWKSGMRKPSQKLATKAVRMEQKSARRAAQLSKAATRAAWREDRLADRDTDKRRSRKVPVY